jgi:hypothetical protein
MAKPNAKQKILLVHCPTADAWNEAVRRFNSEEKLSGYKIEAIAEAVQQTILLCEQINAEPGRAVVKKKAEKLQKLFGNLAHELRSMETQKDMTSITADKDLLDFLSVSAAEASLGQAMLKAVQSMQVPFTDWLFQHGGSRGGRHVQTARQALLFCLIKNYEEIFCAPIGDGAELRLRALSTHLFPACNVSSDGLEDAVGRAFKEFVGWALWDSLPTLQPNDQEWLETRHENIPDDPEPPMMAVKPGTKQ